MASSGLERALALVARLAAPLALVLSLCLFLQWPLREIVQAYSREANDLGQILFAFYVAVAITEATRRGTHLAADALAHDYPPAVRKWLERAGSALVLVPWAAFILYAGAVPTWHSLLQLEHFQETLNPGYFLIRVAVLVLAVLVLAQAMRDLISGASRE